MSVSLIDTHCHLASPRLRERLPEILQNCRDQGVGEVIVQSTCLEDMAEYLEMARSHSMIKVAVGIHPCDVHESPDNFASVLREAAGQESVVAIGETGLDYFHPAPEGWTEEAYRARQKDFLTQHFELAEAVGLPVVLHMRDRTGSASFDEALELASGYAGRVDFVFHCFPGPVEMARRALEAGAHLSFTGIATFKNAKDCLEAALAVPAGRLMVETDAPYLAPVPRRGKTCEPAFVRHTAECLAAARGESLEAFAAHTTATAKAFFRRRGR